MTTFSQMVDELTQEVRRPDMLLDIATYLNQTVRECHFTPDKGNAILYRENLREVSLTADVETGFGWDVPDPTVFQDIAAVRYDSLFARDPETRWIPEKTPGRGMAGVNLFYYRAGPRYSFSGYGGLNSQLSLAYYEYPRRLKYYTVAQRPAQYDSDMGWTYAPAFDSSEELRLAAQNFTTNWLLTRWADVISEGLRAKVYKRVSDTDRARTCYSLYSTLRQGLYTSESMYV